MDYEIRIADFADNRAFSNAINACGGTSYFKAIFGQYNFASLLEYSTLSLCSLYGEEKDSCSGFLSLSDTIACGNELDFSVAISALSEYIPIKETNTLFINLWLLDDRQRRCDSIGNDLVKTAFDKCPQVDFLVWICPRSVNNSGFVEKTFSIIDNVDPKDFKFLVDMSVLFVHRSNILPRLSVRDARVEDTDDLIPILKLSNPNLSDVQGSNILADLIQSQDESNHFFVGCSGNRITGMLATSIEVNMALIVKVFDIDPFADLVIQKAELPRPPPTLISICGDIRLIDSTTLEDICENLGCIFVNAETLDISTEEEGIFVGLSALQSEIKIKSAEAISKGVPPVACLVYGFPRNEDDADAMIDMSFTFNTYLELQNISEDADIDDNDDFCNFHVDGIEVLRSKWFVDDDVLAPDLSVVFNWQRCLVDNSVQSVSETIEQIQKDIHGFVKTRAQEVEEIEMQYRQEPPKANAFAITSFCIEPENASRSEDLLRIAFEDNNNKDYGLFMIPCNSAPNRLVDFMVPVRLRSGVCFDQALFVVHREALNAGEYFHILRYTEKQSAMLTDFLSPQNPQNAKKMQTFCTNTLRESDVELRDNPGEVSFVACISHEIVGVINLSRKIVSLEDINWFRANFELDDQINFERHRGRSQACIVQWLLSPIYFRWAKYMLQEVMRLYGKSLLYYNEQPTLALPLQVIQEMIPIRPRRRIQHINGRPAQPYLERPSEGAPGLGSITYAVTKRHLSLPRPTILTRVVIVGGNMSSFAMLEMLVFLKNIHLMNISIILESPPGPMHFNKTQHSEHTLRRYLDDYCGCLSPFDTSCPTESEFNSFGYAHKVNVITGRLTDIDRSNRAIVVSNEIIVEYDVLVVANCVQDCSFRRFPQSASFHPAVCAERGIFGLGNPQADYRAISWIKKKQSDFSKIVVYGKGITGLNTVGRLLNYGIQSSRIIYISRDNLTSYFEEEPQMAEMAVLFLQHSGIQYYFRKVIRDVGFARTRALQSVTVESDRSVVDATSSEEGNQAEEKSSELVMNCETLLCCAEMACEMDTFAAINDCGLVYDGGLVVDQEFRTIDPYIFGVGDFTKHSRVFRDSLPHHRYNPKEIGYHACLKILEKYLDPLSPSVCYERMHVDTSSTSSIVKRSLARESRPTVPAFVMPRSFYYDLPGGLYCFESMSPRCEIGSNLVTGDIESESMALLKVDPLGMTTKFTYVGKYPIEERNFSCVVGWHESYLNGAVVSFEQGIIEDWTEFLRQDWALVLYFDKFADFAEMIRTSLQTDKGMFSILDRVFEVAETSPDNYLVASGRRKVIGDRCEMVPETTVKSVETYTLDFLRKNRISLTRYFVPQPGQFVSATATVNTGKEAK